MGRWALAAAALLVALAAAQFANDRRFDSSLEETLRARPRSFFADSASEAVTRELEAAGLERATADEQWDVWWTVAKPDDTVFRTLHRHARINHLPHADALCNASQLATHLRELAANGLPGFADVAPRVIAVPDAWHEVERELLAAGDESLVRTRILSKQHALEPRWLFRPSDGGAPRVLLNAKQLTNLRGARGYLQELPSGLLVDGRRFEVSLWAAVTSIDPLRAHVFRGASVRVAREAFPQRASTAKLEAFSDAFIVPDDAADGSQLSLAQALAQLSEAERVVVVDRMLDRARKALTATWASLAAEARQFQLHPDNLFPLLRFDFVIDTARVPWLTAVRQSPQLGGEAPELLRATLALAGLTVEHRPGAAAAINSAALRLQQRRLAASNCLLPVCQICDATSLDTRCALCPQCVSPRQAYHLRMMLVEQHRGGASFALLWPSADPIRKAAVPTLFREPRDPATPQPPVYELQESEWTRLSFLAALHNASCHASVGPSTAQRTESLRGLLAQQIAAERLEKDQPGTLARGSLLLGEYNSAAATPAMPADLLRPTSHLVDLSDIDLSRLGTSRPGGDGSLFAGFTLNPFLADASSATDAEQRDLSSAPWPAHDGLAPWEQPHLAAAEVAGPDAEAAPLAAAAASAVGVGPISALSAESGDETDVDMASLVRARDNTQGVDPDELRKRSESVLQLLDFGDEARRVLDHASRHGIGRERDAKLLAMPRAELQREWQAYVEEMRQRGVEIASLEQQGGPTEPASVAEQTLQRVSDDELVAQWNAPLSDTDRVRAMDALLAASQLAPTASPPPDESTVPKRSSSLIAPRTSPQRQRFAPPAVWAGAALAGLAAVLVFARRCRRRGKHKDAEESGSARDTAPAPHSEAGEMRRRFVV
jgi:hypothetical protein